MPDSGIYMFYIDSRQYYIHVFIMYIHYSFFTIDKQTTVTRESDPGEVNCYGNVSYGNVTMKSKGFENEEDGNEDKYDCMYM